MRILKDKLLFTIYKEYVLMARSSDGEIIELQFEPLFEKSILGNMYVGRVENVVKNLNAAFVSYKKGETAYLPLDEADSPFFTENSGAGGSMPGSRKLPVKQGDNIVIQIVNEAIKNKPPKATARYLDFTGRYAILTFGKQGLGVSAKITDKNLRSLFAEEFSEYLSEDYGVLIRTNAQNAELKEVHSELKALIKEAETIKNTAMQRTKHTLLRAEEKSYITELRNIRLKEISEIITDDERIYNELFLYAGKYGSACSLITLKEPEYIKNAFGLETVIKHALSQRVWLKCGGYIVIQPTEALTVIDVNSGKYVIKKNDTNSAARHVNYEACDMIAKQIRLRNLSGIILVDFIDMNDAEREDLLKYLRQKVEADRVKTVVVDVTKLYLVEITRKKIKKPIYEQLDLL